MKSFGKITLSGSPISTQHLYGQRGRIRYMKADAKKKKEDYIEQVTKQRKKEIISCEIGMEIYIYFGDKRKRDWDNYHKIAIDSLSGIVIEDDSQIKRAIVNVNIDKDNPRYVIDLFYLN